jgi:hypothetical protein
VPADTPRGDGRPPWRAVEEWGGGGTLISPWGTVTTWYEGPGGYLKAKRDAQMFNDSYALRMCVPR